MKDFKLVGCDPTLTQRHVIETSESLTYIHRDQKISHKSLSLASPERLGHLAPGQQMFPTVYWLVLPGRPVGPAGASPAL